MYKALVLAKTALLSAFKLKLHFFSAAYCFWRNCTFARTKSVIRKCQGIYRYRCNRFELGLLPLPNSRFSH